MCAQPGGQPELPGWVTAPPAAVSLPQPLSQPQSVAVASWGLPHGRTHLLPCCPASHIWLCLDIAGNQLPATGLRGPSCPALFYSLTPGFVPRGGMARSGEG